VAAAGDVFLLRDTRNAGGKKSDGSGRPQFDGIPLAPFLLSTFTPRIFIGFPRPADFFPASAAQAEPAEISTTKEKSRPLTCR